MSSDTMHDDDLHSNGRLKSVSFWSEPAVDGCEVLRATRPYDNPAIDIFRKRNRLVLRFEPPNDPPRLELRWWGGLIARVVYLVYGQTPALGIEEVDPDGTLTRRLVYLDGRSRPFGFHPGPFDAGPPAMNAKSGRRT